MYMKNKKKLKVRKVEQVILAKMTHVYIINFG